MGTGNEIQGLPDKWKLIHCSATQGPHDPPSAKWRDADIINLLCGIADQANLFAKHTEAVGKFLSEMYAVMVDPLDDHHLKVKELCELLLARANEDRESLANLHSWKAQQLGVESTWSPQEVANELGLRWGAPIRAEILPAIKALKAENTSLRAEIQRLKDELDELRYCPT